MRSRVTIALGAALAGALLGGGPPARAEAPPRWSRPPGPERRPDPPAPARTPRARALPKSVELAVGERVSFSSVAVAGVMDPTVARVSVERQVLTVGGVRPGKTWLVVTRAARPGARPAAGEKIPVSVRP